MQTHALRIVLVISLIINLFALGAFGGAAWMWTHRPSVAHPHHGRPIIAAGDALPVTDRQRFLTAMHQVLVDGRPLQRTARESRRAAADAFVQANFDADAINADLGQARDADFALRAKLEGAVVDYAKTLSPSERASLANGLAHGGPLRQPK